MYANAHTIADRLAALVPILLLAAAVAGCTERNEEPPPSPVPLSFERIGHGQHADLRDTTEVVIRDSTTWATYRAQLRPYEPFAGVHFDTSMVLLVAIPVRTGGHSIEFEAVEERDDEIVARYEFSVPGNDCMTSMGLSTPFQAVRIPTSDAPVRFERERYAYSCAVRE